MDFAGRLRALMAERGIGVRALARSVYCDHALISRYAAGKEAPSAKMAGLIDDSLGAGGELVTLAADTAPPASLAAESALASTLDLTHLADASDIGAGTVGSVAESADLLCRAYSTTPPADLSARLRQRLAYVLQLLGKRLTLREHRDLLVQAGWLAALLGCCHFDLDEREEAEAARQAAARMARQAGHGELLAWAHEMRAWFALVDRRYGDVIGTARAGQNVAGTTSAMVQLVLQEAKAHAGLGAAAEATRCLDRGAAILGKLPRPSHPEHHFIFDHTKYLSYSSIVLLRVDPALTEECARGVLAAETDPEGAARAPRRIANARLDLATVYALRGDLDGAVAEGVAAFGDHDHTSVAGLVSRGAELSAALRQRYPGERLADGYHERLAAARRALNGARRAHPLH